MDGFTLNKLLELGAEHALYEKNGVWYHPLRRFPCSQAYPYVCNK